MSSSIRWGISPGKWRLSEQLLSSGISEVSRAWEQSDALLLFPFFASCLSAEWERQPGMAEGRENLCFVPAPWLTLSGTYPGTSFIWCLKRSFSQGLSEVSWYSVIRIHTDEPENCSRNFDEGFSLGLTCSHEGFSGAGSCFNELQGL